MIIPTQNIIFINTPDKNPINEPTAARKASRDRFPAINSPTKAPTNGKMNTPYGGKRKMPNTIPIVLPHVPPLLPPYFFVPIAGTT